MVFYRVKTGKEIRLQSSALEWGRQKSKLCIYLEENLKRMTIQTVAYSEWKYLSRYFNLVCTL